MLWSSFSKKKGQKIFKPDDSWIAPGSCDSLIMFKKRSSKTNSGADAAKIDAGAIDTASAKSIIDSAESKLRLTLKTKFEEKSIDGELDKETFKSVVVDILTEQGVKKMPSAKDLDMAFEIADANSSDSVSLLEFMSLCSLIKKGDVYGLSKQSMMTSSKKKRASFLAKLQNETAKEDDAIETTDDATRPEENITSAQNPTSAPERIGTKEENDVSAGTDSSLNADDAIEPINESESTEHTDKNGETDMAQEEESTSSREKDKDEHENEDIPSDDYNIDIGDDAADDIEDDAADDAQGMFAEGDLVETACGEEGEDEYWMPAQIIELLYDEENKIVVDG